MNRSLATFLIFVIALVTGGIALLWWAGPAMVSLALDGDRRSTPYYLIQLLDEADPAAYFQTFGALLREEQAQLLWRGGLKALHAGRTRDELTDVALIQFDEGAGVVQMLTSSTYRSLTERSAPILLGTPLPPGPIAQDETVLLWLMSLDEGAGSDVLHALAATASACNGQLVWSTPVAVLEGDRSWNHALLIAFPDANALADWLANPAAVTERALSRRHYTSEAMLELSSG